MRKRCELCGERFPVNQEDLHRKKRCRKRKVYLRSLAEKQAEPIVEKPEVIEAPQVEEKKKVVKKVVSKKKEG